MKPKPQPSAEETSRQTLSEAHLLAYLEGRLSEPERQALEMQLADEGMVGDTLEGLQALRAAEVHALKQQLHKSLWKRIGRRRRRRGLGSQFGNLSALAIIILLAIACLMVFWMLRK